MIVTKRYLCFFTVFFALMLGVSVKIEHVAIIWPAIAVISSIILLCSFIFRKKLLGLFCCLGILTGVLFYSAFTGVIVEPLYSLNGETYAVYAEICNYPEIYEDSQRAEIRIDTKQSEIQYFKPWFNTLIYLPLTSESLEPGDRIHVTTKFYIPTLSEGFDKKSYQASQGRFIHASSTGIEDDFVFEVVQCDRIPVRYLPVALAMKWKTQFNTIFEPRIAGFMTSLVLGDRSGLSDMDYINLKKSGLSHIVAVSGMHLTFLVAFLTKIFGKHFGTIISVPVLLFFSCMAGNTPSVMRALIMVAAASISFLFMDEIDSLTVLALSLMILLLHNPYSIANVGLQLSYLSTLGLMLYSDRINYYLNRPFNNFPLIIRKTLSWVSSAIACSLSAMIFTSPILLYTFGYVSLVSPLSNLAVLGVVSLVFVCGIISCVFPFISSILAVPIQFGAECILMVAEKCADIWWLILDWYGMYAKIALIIGFVCVLTILHAKYSKPKFTLPILCVILGLCIRMNALEIEATVKTTIHAVGDGQMITVASGRDSVVLIDCGSGSNRKADDVLAEYMIWNDFDEIDLLIFTAVDKTHARAFSSVSEQYPINHMIIPSNLQNNDFTASVFEQIQRRDIPVTEWTSEGENELSGYPLNCSLIGGTNRKLGVHLHTHSGDLLILHSFTQKMMDELLQQVPLRTDLIVLSPNNLENTNLLKNGLSALSPTEIIFPAGGDYIASKLYGIPTRNTYLEGEIVFYSDREME